MEISTTFHENPYDLEKLITKEAEETGVRYRKLGKYLYRKCGLSNSENTIKAVLRIER